MSHGDINSLLVHSAGLLFVTGNEDLEYVVEDSSVDWIKGDLMGSPELKFHLIAGTNRSAFTGKEVTKLSEHNTCERTTLVTDNSYFPFLVRKTLGYFSPLY
jgi:hypothetical protein